MPRLNTERVPTITRYVVRGSLAFPIDMLRYDACTPATEEDSHTIERTLSHENEGAVEVTLRFRTLPTVARWASFGWTVVAVIDPVTGDRVRTS